MGHMIPTLNCCDVKMLFNKLIAIAVVSMVFVPGILPAQNEAPAKVEEYFVQQAADEALLIKVSAFEAEFESKVTEQGGQSILHSSLPGSRIVPVFQYIHQQNEPRQLNIEISSNLYTGRTEFGLALTRMAVWDNRSSSVDQAFQLLSFGTQVSDDKSAADWTVKIDSLANAGRLFERFGMKEMRLWSNYLAANLIHFHLHDFSIALSMSREILTEVKGTRMRDIELASLQLQAFALMGLKHLGKLQRSGNKPDPVQTALMNTARLAQTTGFYFEQSQALKFSGDEYFAESDYVRALSQYQQAVVIADRVGDAELATGIRESIVQIHAVQGDVPATSTVLQEIETQLLAEGGDELALNLLAQGRLFSRSYKYLQAYEALSQAMIHQNNSAIRKQVNFELAIVFYETGRLERAKTYLQLADIGIETENRRRGSTVINRAEGFRVLANIYRINGNHKLMKTARTAQGNHQPPSAAFHYERGLDELAQTGGSEQKARSLFSQSGNAASAFAQLDLKNLALLQYCALNKPAGEQAGCSRQDISAAFTWLESSGVPAYSAEAMYLWAKILVNNGRSSRALAVLDRLISDMHFYRHSLPGVLGAWYRERNATLFSFYLGQVLRNGRNAKQSLLALSKIRFTESYTGSDPVSTANTGNTELLRVQLRERTESGSAGVMVNLSDNIKQGMSGLRDSFDRQFAFLSKKGLQTYLDKLSDDEVVLTYQISPQAARVWIAKRQAVRQVDIANPAQLYTALNNVQRGLANIGVSSFERNMDVLGKQLLSPVASSLTKKVYLAPAGILLGFPFDALRLNGRFLVEDHSIANLLSFPSNPDPQVSLQRRDIENVFLAGHPQDYSSDYAFQLNTSSAIQVVADIFVGPGLDIIQGTALLPDEFKSDQFQQAELIHLAMPGKIDLRNPEQSRLELSGDEDEPERESLDPLEVRQQAVAGSLVFLSTTQLGGKPISEFHNRPALIGDFLAAGASSVIAGYWAAEGVAANSLIADFYLKLVGSGNIAVSLQQAKRRYINEHSADGLFDWAGYQLFIE